jgi:hypothetical protein
MASAEMGPQPSAMPPHFFRCRLTQSHQAGPRLGWPLFNLVGERARGGVGVAMGGRCLVSSPGTCDQRAHAATGDAARRPANRRCGQATSSTKSVIRRQNCNW